MPLPSRRRRLAILGLTSCAVLGPGPASAAPAGNPLAQGPPTTTGVTAGPAPTAGYAPDGKDTPWLDDPRVDPALAGVSVDSVEFKLALTRYRTTEQNLATAVRTGEEASGRLAEETAAETRLVGTRNQALRRHDKSAARLEVVRADLADLAVDDYVRGAEADPLSAAFDPESTTDDRRVRVLVTSVRAQRLAEARENAAVVADMDQVIAATDADLADVRGRIAADTQARDGAAADEARFRAQLGTDAKALADARLTGNVTGVDFAFVALDAYVKAAGTLQREQPSCGIRWTLVAAISRTEGRHGTYGGSTLDADGNTTKPIIGIALDGSNGTAAIGDSDGGQYDGDPAFDRAVGPMQFIPMTWARMARDGNGDGRADPQNIYDASLAAAAYLCRQGPGLDTDEGMLRALRSYNNDGAYGQLVLERTHGYDAFVLPAPPPGRSR